MPEAVVGQCARCWARWGGIGGGNFYIWEGLVYYMPIWDVLAPQGVAGGSGRACGNMFQLSGFPIRQAVPVGLWARFCSWARWARFFIEKKVYCGRHSVFTYNLLFYKLVSRREWMDGVELVRMTTSKLGRRSQLGFAPWARWARFFMFKNMYITSYSIFTHNIPFINIRGCRNK
jgi:hypothetical protein